MGNVPVTVYPKPSEIRFTHGVIEQRFSDGTPLEETFRKILNGEILMNAKTMPPLVVMYYGGYWYVIKGNRRLYLLRKLEQLGIISNIKVVRQPFDGFLLERNYTTTNAGMSATVKGRPKFDGRLNRIFKEWRDQSMLFCCLVFIYTINNLIPSQNIMFNTKCTIM